MKIPKAPDDETRLRHNLTHVPFADWCDICVRSRARDDPHKKQHGKEEQAEPEVSMDYFNLGLNYNMQFPALAVIDHCTGALMATGIRCKGADKFTVKAVCEFLGFLGYPRMSLKSDGESSILTLVEAVISRMHTEENVKRISPTTSPVGSHQSNGMAEVGVQLAEAVARTFTLAVEQRYGVEVKPTSSILPWAVRHAAYVYTRFQVRRNGKTPYEDLTMKKFTSPMVEFGEIVHGREQGERQHNLKIIWKTGVWLGRAVDTGDHLLGCPDGVYKARAVRRMADEKDRWDRTVFDQMIWLPWATNVSELNLVGEEWTPTASCRACEGGAKAGHNKRCNDRRTEWAKIREHTAALQASSVGNPKVAAAAADPTFVRTPAALSRAAMADTAMPAASGANSSTAAAAPPRMDVDTGEPASGSASGPAPAQEESDPKRFRIVGKKTTTRENLKRAGEPLDPEVASEVMAGNDVDMQIYLMQMENNDEPDAIVEWARDENLQYRNRLEEIETWGTFNAYERVTHELWMRAMSMVWVDKPEKSRLCVRGFERKLYGADELYTPTPFPVSMQVLLVIAWCESLVVRRFDVCRAFLHTPSKTPTYVKPPPEASEPADICWSLNVTAYGLEEAMTEFDEHFSDQTSKLPHPFRRCKGDPSVFVGTSNTVIFSRHVDDGMAIGKEEDINVFFTELEEKFALKT